MVKKENLRILIFYQEILDELNWLFRAVTTSTVWEFPAVKVKGEPVSVPLEPQLLRMRMNVVATWFGDMFGPSHVVREYWSPDASFM